MPKELTIVFVYNTDLVKHEYDDPALAVLYFCPSWLPDDKKTTLCGQIIGAAHFLKSVFNPIHIISLQNGKFCVKEYGKYIMAIGTDRSIPNWILEKKATFLSSLIEMFHVDFGFMSTFYKDSQTFIEKINQVFESYLGLLNLEMLAYKVPDFSESKMLNQYTFQAQNFLNNALKSDYVLAGLVQWNKKLLATQVNAILTKCLLLTNETKKHSAECIMTDFQFPKNLQLLHMYLKMEDYREIMENAKQFKKNCKSENYHDQKEKVNANRNDVIKIRKNDTTEKISNEWNSLELSCSELSIKSCEAFKNDLKVQKSSSLSDIHSNSIQDESIYGKTLCDPLYPYVNRKGRAITKKMYLNNSNVDIFENEKGSKYYSFASDRLEDKKYSVIKKTDIKGLRIMNGSVTSKDSLYDTVSTQNGDVNEISDSNKEIIPNNKSEKLNGVRLMENEFKKTENLKFKECVLFLLNFQNIIINLILEEEASNSSEIINSLYEKCSSYSEELSEKLENFVEVNTASEMSSTSQENSSYLFTNHNWDYTDEGGMRENLDFDLITRMHQDLLINEDITDMAFRNDDSVLYGHQNENKVVYYQTKDYYDSGVPAPSNSVANIFSKARRRLSRTSRSSSLNLM